MTDKLSLTLGTLKQKIKTLQEQESKIYQAMTADLSKLFIESGALDIDLDILFGGLKHVIEKAKTPSPDCEVWKKSGQTFRRHLAKRKGSKVSLPAETPGKN